VNNKSAFYRDCDLSHEKCFRWHTHTVNISIGHTPDQPWHLCTLALQNKI